MTITTRLFTFFNGKLIGVDQYGNRYFSEKKIPKDRREKRWVMYNGIAESSKVPPEWRSWLHYTQNVPPSKRTISHHEWEKPHMPNLTGTKNAYVPKGHLLRDGQRQASSADYEAWKP